MTASDQPYSVLYRKYRPALFSSLIGQDALVRTLGNAFSRGRIAQAFLLTGIRGVGKTSTARIIARSLNCVDGPTVTPCGTCPACVSIAQNSAVDIVEIDAASNNGVDNVREIINGVNYAPLHLRYKIYIIDEVHMLSKQAFNALLKTLEEPPSRVIFIFATTEQRKIPVTILSRCQKFNLRRVPADLLRSHFEDICRKEDVSIDGEALDVIARAADGSVRDGLSILDQAIATSNEVRGEDVRLLLGLAERTESLAIMDLAMAGKAGDCIRRFRALVDQGADALSVLHDMMGYVHYVCVVASDPALADDPAVPEFDRRLGGARAKTVGLAKSHQCWQTLLKAVADVQSAPVPRQAVELSVLRCAAICAG